MLGRPISLKLPKGSYMVVRLLCLLHIQNPTSVEMQIGSQKWLTSNSQKAFESSRNQNRTEYSKFPILHNYRYHNLACLYLKMSNITLSKDRSLIYNYIYAYIYTHT